jgi:DNA-binding CsgD family transcriptional regulator
MTSNTEVGRGWESFRNQNWANVYFELSKELREKSLEAKDLEKLAIAAYLIGKDTESDDYWTQAHHEYLEHNKKTEAARCAFWLGFKLMFKGERARGSGWISRAGTILKDGKIDSVMSGYLLIPVALKNMGEGDFAKAYELFNQVLDTSDRFDDPDLKTLGRLGRGQALIRLGETRNGVGQLDEAMAAVEAAEVSPIVAGIVYCAVIEACQEIYDLRRAQEWTSALSRWCESQPDLVPFRGQCLVRRAEIMQLHGTLKDAMNETQKACELLTQSSGEPAAGEAFYRKGELHRIRGEFTKAEEAYQNANKWGRHPQPGLALLQLGRGQTEAAKKMILQFYNENQDRLKRTRILSAYIEIMLAANEIRLAREATEELTNTATEFDTPYLHAISIHAHGSVLLAEGNPQEALNVLREAWSSWEKLEAPYESACTRVNIALACRELNDMETAKMEFEAAKWIFQRLNAVPDINRVDSFVHQNAPDNKHGLTPRQLDVLRHIAAGKSNKEIAEKLYISSRTVERHVSDLFNKLNVSSRAAATAFAYEHKLI